jgi:hypothetical protein
MCIFYLPIIKLRGTHHLFLLILVAEVGQDKYITDWMTARCKLGFAAV